MPDAAGAVVLGMFVTGDRNKAVVRGFARFAQHGDPKRIRWTGRLKFRFLRMVGDAVKIVTVVFGECVMFGGRSLKFLPVRLQPGSFRRILRAIGRDSKPWGFFAVFFVDFLEL